MLMSDNYWLQSNYLADIMFFESTLILNEYVPIEYVQAQKCPP